MRITKQSRQDAKALFRGCLMEGRLEADRVRMVVDQMLAGRPRGYRATLQHFTRLVRLELERKSARIDSATPLAAGLEAELKANLTRRYGAGLEFSTHVEPSLLAGVRVRVGSDVYDGTVRHRLDRLREDFATA
jgi:F-type H+-transporting ATPase subunit delta